MRRQPNPHFLSAVRCASPSGRRLSLSLYIYLFFFFLSLSLFLSIFFLSLFFLFSLFFSCFLVSDEAVAEFSPLPPEARSFLRKAASAAGSPPSLPVLGHLRHLELSCFHLLLSLKKIAPKVSFLPKSSKKCPKTYPIWNFFWPNICKTKDFLFSLPSVFHSIKLRLRFGAGAL